MRLGINIVSIVVLFIFTCPSLLCQETPYKELLHTVNSQLCGNNLWPEFKKDTSFIRYVNFHIVAEDSSTVSVALSVVDLSPAPTIRIITMPNLIIAKTILPSVGFARLIVPLVIRQNDDIHKTLMPIKPEEHLKIISPSDFGYEITDPIIVGHRGSQN